MNYWNVSMGNLKEKEKKKKKKKKKRRWGGHNLYEYPLFHISLSNIKGSHNTLADLWYILDINMNYNKLLTEHTYIYIFICECTYTSLYTHTHTHTHTHTLPSKLKLYYIKIL